MILLLAVLICAARADETGPSPAAGASGWGDVEKALGRTGTLLPDGVFKVSMPRSDLNVTVGDVHVAPALALGSWVAFKDTGNGSMVMGDLVLAEGEVSPVMEKLQQGGVEQTALHNHLLGETPRVLYMHIAGHGDPVRLAGAIHDALALTGTPANVSAAALPANGSLKAAYSTRPSVRKGSTTAGSTSSASRERTG